MPPTVVFPQYASGLSGDTRNRTRLILRNDGTAATSGSVRFLDSNGASNPLAIGGETKSEVPYSKTHSAFVSRSNSENTGVAMYNPSLTVGVLIEVRLCDKTGALVAGPTNLAARHQAAVFVDNSSLFQSCFAGISGAFEGTLKLSVTSGGPISVISLIQTAAVLLQLPVPS